MSGRNRASSQSVTIPKEETLPETVSNEEVMPKRETVSNEEVMPKRETVSNEEVMPKRETVSNEEKKERSIATIEITVPMLNVREEPQGKIVKVLEGVGSEHQVYQDLDETGKWAQLVDGSGWIATEFTTID